MTARATASLETRDTLGHLPRDDGLCLPAFLLRQVFTDAQDGNHTCVDNRTHLMIDHLVGFAKQRAALRMSSQDVLRPEFGKHQR